MAKLILDGSDEEYEIEDGSPIADVCEEAGVPFACTEGVCGTCVIEVQEGMENLSEFTQEEETATSGTATFTYDEDTRALIITAWSQSDFVSGDAKGDVYVRPGNLVDNGGGEDILNAKLLKIVRYASTSSVEVIPIEPSTGGVIAFDSGFLQQTSINTERVVISTLRCRVSDIKDADGGSSIAATEVARTGLTTASMANGRVDKANRIVIDATTVGTDFVTAAVEVGDKVVWDNHSSIPFTNNGTYRISKIIDKETIEVVAEDWGPVYLNYDMSTPGDISISTDGKFYKDPFVVFDPTGAIPDDGVDSINVAYLGMSTFRDATDDPAIFSGGRVRYSQEADDSTQRAILAIVGPSATTIDAFLFSDRRINLEDLDLTL